MKKVCIKGDGTKEYGEKIKKYFNGLGGKNYFSWSCEQTLYYYIDKYGDIMPSARIPQGYTEISLKETRKHIGWTVKKGCEQYLEAADKIANLEHISMRNDINNKIMFQTNSPAYNRLKQANVLEAWFEKVYEEELKVGDWWCDYKEQYSSIRNKVFPIVKIDADGVWGKDKVGSSYLPRKRFFEVFRKATPEEIEAAQIRLPRINGYDGEYDKQTGYVKYGCATLDTANLVDIRNCKIMSSNRQIKSIALDSEVTITMEQIEQILKYVNNQ